MPRDSGPIEDFGVIGRHSAALSEAVLWGRTEIMGPGSSTMAAGPATILSSEQDVPEAERMGVRVSRVTLSSIILPDLTRPTVEATCFGPSNSPGAGTGRAGTSMEGTVRGRSRACSHFSRCARGGIGAPDLAWIGRYGRTGDHIRLIGWDVVPLVQKRVQRKVSHGNDVTGADIAILHEICRRMAPVGGHYRVSLALSDHTLPDETFVQAMKAVFAETGFTPQALRLVLDERRFSLAGRDEARCLAALVDWGVELWVGRFGQGVSSLSLLRERAGSGLIAGVSLEAGLVSAPSGLWRVAHQKQERLDPVAAKFFSATCGALQAIGIKTHFARIACSAQYGFALAAAFDEMSGLCPELEGIAMEAMPPCA